MSTENGLMEIVFEFLWEKLDDFVNRTRTQSFLKLDNCISNHNFTLVEPVVS